MDNILFYAPKRTNRLIYVLDWVFKERLGVDYQFTDSIEKATIVYGTLSTLGNQITIPQAGLLELCVTDGPVENEGYLAPIQSATGTWQQYPVLFYEPAGYSLPFDILSAIFYLLSRYEEYAPNTCFDKHQRYKASCSILYELNVLTVPIVDIWVTHFGTLITQTLAIQPRYPAFSYIPSYDIDIAYSFLHKGFMRTAGAVLKNIITGNISELKHRYQVNTGAVPDPYDSFSTISKLHTHHSTKPLFFILSALHTTAYDKNILPHHPAMQQIIKNIHETGTVGIHPSYYAHNARTFRRELNVLQSTIRQSITISRQHYIKFTIPDTYRLLIEQGIDNDYSMGYGTHLGFRAGTGSSFLWYDLFMDEVTNLRIYPFCFMDTTALYEQKLSSQSAFEALSQMQQYLMQNHSLLITIFHNFSLGSAKEWKGWGDAYKQWLKEVK